MKKLLVLSLVIFLSILSTRVVSASEYTSYQDFEFKHNGAKFLDDFSKTELKDYYDRIDHKRFWGWKIYTIFKTEEVYYTKETLLMIYNEGDTAITDTFTITTESSVRKQYNVSGSLKLKASTDIKKAKLGFEEKLDYSITATTYEQSEIEITIKVNVDPLTKLKVQICGEGKVSSGVAKYYRFWRTAKKGGWEIFIVTTEYYSITKEYINET